MRASRARTIGLLLVAASCVPVQAQAQVVFESVGERALGMGGAFVAVANDATAVYWNPAGLATAVGAGMTIGWYRFQSGNQNQTPVPGPALRSGTFTSLGATSAGLSYGQLQATTLTGGTLGQPNVETLSVSQYGLTILQTIVPGLVAGTTLKYLRGNVIGEPVTAASVKDALAQTNNLNGPTKTALDLDIGLMATADHLRVGYTMKNVRQPSFGDVANSANTLQRQSRLGVAFISTGGLTLAMDLDLNAVGLQGDLRRMFALGGEVHLGHALQVRSGVRWDLEGTHDPIAAIGMSVTIRRGIWVDGHYAVGRTDEDREFGVALRAGL